MRPPLPPSTRTGIRRARWVAGADRCAIFWNCLLYTSPGVRLAIVEKDGAVIELYEDKN